MPTPSWPSLLYLLLPACYTWLPLASPCSSLLSRQDGECVASYQIMYSLHQRCDVLARSTETEEYGPWGKVDDIM